jgi:hypothetical protein
LITEKTETIEIDKETAKVVATCFFGLVVVATASYLLMKKPVAPAPTPKPNIST